MSVWDRLVGQERLIAALSSVVADPSQMTHAWLFLGPAGSGRTTAARSFAAALECESLGCGVCPVCRQVFAGTHPEVIVWTTEGLTLKVDDARELVRDASRAVSGGRWRVIIIEDADRLNEKAANALLKALEEPPPRTVWMLCAPSESADTVEGGILPTIRSRCRVLSLSVPSPASIAALLSASGVSAAEAAWAASASQGHVGRARRLATDEAARLRRASVLGIPPRLTSLAAAMTAAADLVAVATEDAAAVTSSMDVAETTAMKEAVGTGRGTAGVMKELADNQKSRATRLKRDTLDLALIDLAAYYRDVLMVQLGAPVLPVHPDVAASVAALAVRTRAEDSVAAITAVLACREALEGNVAPQLAVEQFLVTVLPGHP